MEKSKIVGRLSRIGILGNVALSVFKLLAGIFGHSGAMISDAVHSLSDVFATLVAWMGVRLSGKKADAGHPYGHERFECVASLALGLILAGTGIAIGWSSLKNIISGEYRTAAVPGLLPLIAAVVSIVCKEAMFRYTMHYAKVLNSPAFKADAWHHRSDALSSIGSLVGIAAARLGLPIADPLAGFIICFFILKVAYSILKDALSRMVDSSCGAETEKAISDYIRSVPGVVSLDLLRTRMFGSRSYAEVEIAADRSLSLVEAHEIAERVHSGLEGHFPELKHVAVHVNPTDEPAAV